jgi:hypothetical protein
MQTFRCDEVSEPGQPSVRIDPTIHGLAACLKALETEALLLGRQMAASLIGSARLALIDP